MMKACFKKCALSSAILSVLFLAGCLPTLDTSSEAERSDDNGPDSTGSDLTQGPSLSGIVADGYLVNAKVCLDVNHNKKCDDAEPATISSAGGKYTLVVPDDVNAASHPIVVEVIPHVTVDEDDGQTIDQGYVLSAPPGKTAFVSPLTTMVHAQLERHPALNVDEAENLIKGQLDYEPSSDISLFEDYVAAKQPPNSTNANDYERLHNVAQVTAKSMASNIQKAQDAAGLAGLDIEDVFDEIVSLIVQEVIAGLDDITREVDDAGDAFEATTSNGVNTGLDASNIIRAVEGEKLASAVTPVSVQQILASGLNWTWGMAHTEWNEETQREVRVSQYEYGRVANDTDNDRLTAQNYAYDMATGLFVPHNGTDIMLGSDGKWAEVSENLSVVFNDDGSATITNSKDGVTYNSFSAVGASVDVSGQRIAEFLDHDSETWKTAMTNPDALFEDGASVYRFTLVQKQNVYEIWNDDWCEDDIIYLASDPTNAVDAYDALNGNCNALLAWGWDEMTGNTMISTVTSLEDMIVPSNQELNAAKPVKAFDVGHNLRIEFQGSGDSGVANYYVFNDNDMWTLKATGEWKIETVSGAARIMKYSPPPSVAEKLYNDDGMHHCLTVQNGFVRHCTIRPEGAVEAENDWMFNDIAMQNILDNFDPSATVTEDGAEGEISDTLSACETNDSGWNNENKTPIMKADFATFQTTATACKAASGRAFTAADIAGKTFSEADGSGEKFSFNVNGTGTVNDDGKLINFDWEIDNHGYLVLTAKEENVVFARDTYALVASSGDQVSIKGYFEHIDWSDMDRATGADGEIWSGVFVVR